MKNLCLRGNLTLTRNQIKHNDIVLDSRLPYITLCKLVVNPTGRLEKSSLLYR